MMERWKRFRIGAIIISCCILVLGVLMILWPDISAVIVCGLLGALCIVAGIYELVRYFKLGFLGVFFWFDLTLGLCNILLGILLLIHPQGAVVFLPVAVGIYIILSSIFAIQFSVEIHRHEIRNWWVALLLGIIGIGFALFLFFDPFDGTVALMIFLGAMLIISSIQNLYLISCISKIIKAGTIHRTNRDGVILEAEWRNIE